MISENSPYRAEHALQFDTVERGNLLMINLTYAQVCRKYEEALNTIADMQMEISNLKQEVGDYCQAFETLQDELSAI